MSAVLPDPAAALSRWHDHLRPGAQVGIATFPVPTGRLGAWTMGTALRRIWSDTDPARHP